MSTSTKGNPCFRRRAQEVADAILKAFQENTLPKALAPVFVHRTDNVPCRSWSWANQLMVAIHGHCDARGYRQWEQTGRHVKKGEKAFPILVLMCKKKQAKDDTAGTDKTGDEKTKTYVYGFTSAPVFGLNQTEGDPLPPPDPKVSAWLDSLPLIDVANSWGLTVDAYNGGKGPQGRYSPGAGIALGVENLSTWAHELCHAADDRLGNLQERGQHWRSETVASWAGPYSWKPWATIPTPTAAGVGSTSRHTPKTPRSPPLPPVNARSTAHATPSP